MSFLSWPWCLLLHALSFFSFCQWFLLWNGNFNGHITSEKTDSSECDLRSLSNIRQHKVFNWEMTSGLHSFKPMLFCYITLYLFGLQSKCVSLKMFITNLELVNLCDWIIPLVFTYGKVTFIEILKTYRVLHIKVIFVWCYPVSVLLPLSRAFWNC